MPTCAVRSWSLPPAGWVTFDQVLDLAPAARTHQPQRAHRAHYDQLCGSFRDLHRRTAKVCVRLNAPD